MSQHLIGRGQVTGWERRGEGNPRAHLWRGPGAGPAPAPAPGSNASPGVSGGGSKPNKPDHSHGATADGPIPARLQPTTQVKHLLIFPAGFVLRQLEGKAFGISGGNHECV